MLAGSVANWAVFTFCELKGAERMGEDGKERATAGEARCRVLGKSLLKK